LLNNKIILVNISDLLRTVRAKRKHNIRNRTRIITHSILLNNNSNQSNSMSRDIEFRRYIEDFLDRMLETDRLERFVYAWNNAKSNGILVDSVKSAVIGDMFGKLMAFGVSVESDLNPSMEIDVQKVVAVVTKAFATRYPEINGNLTRILHK